MTAPPPADPRAAFREKARARLQANARHVRSLKPDVVILVVVFGLIALAVTLGVWNVSMWVQVPMWLIALAVGVLGAAIVASRNTEREALAGRGIPDPFRLDCWDQLRSLRDVRAPYVLVLRPFALERPTHDEVTWDEGGVHFHGVRYDDRAANAITAALCGLKTFAVASPSDATARCLFPLVVLDADRWIDELTPLLQDAALIVYVSSRDGGAGVRAEARLLVEGGLVSRVWLVQEGLAEPDQLEVLALRRAARWRSTVRFTGKDTPIEFDVPDELRAHVRRFVDERPG